MINIKNIEYFNVEIHDFKLIYTPKEIIKDIIWDDGNIIIPFSNGKKYYVYQELVFDLIERLENTVNVTICNDNTELPKIQINLGKLEEEKAKHNINKIIELANDTLTNYINKKFSLWCN